jgi:hypothetical protein
MVQHTEQVQRVELLRRGVEHGAVQRLRLGEAAGLVRRDGAA